MVAVEEGGQEEWFKSCLIYKCRLVMLLKKVDGEPTVSFTTRVDAVARYPTNLNGIESYPDCFVPTRGLLPLFNASLSLTPLRNTPLHHGRRTTTRAAHRSLQGSEVEHDGAQRERPREEKQKERRCKSEFCTLEG